MICLIFLQAKREIVKLVDSYTLNDCKKTQNFRFLSFNWA